MVTKYLALFHELYPTREIGDITAEAWEYAFADVTDVGFAWACDRVLKDPSQKFFPVPADIRKYLSGNTDTTPRLANPEDPVGRAVEDYYANGGVRANRLPDFRPGARTA